ncbi:MAG: succinate dehydrogenase, cytochrome b556 subunit [Pseudomonadota bacterium]|jgi:succinate dehydrogenase / fumarate reductase cytochrome b subunit|uniref:Succinate dehydrogenase cytochrome b556 subunit n=1 Tax=Thiothrix fructosivorans TaxID=111770 RepID=A0A8B0SIH4_9GAMM|nr:succinate dehydrogenase, cytochrome b556 subunit [Thiothrix fructosivorans]MBO0611601.1 succinate dehydrogenase, cytochrome b556 subunit [Thiothrix fructosivorans]QTX10735.1 succinate dehydrogenase, cytochrome b556 subunit [Thiothrix fructosivorans]
MKTANKRPLSPHLQVYKPQLTSVLSILHRATGAALAVGTLLVTYWLTSIAGGEESFNSANAILGSWFGRLVLFFWSWALFYHLSNGIRHLMWDSGFGLDLPTVYKSGKIMVGASLALTILLWLVA